MRFDADTLIIYARSLHSKSIPLGKWESDSFFPQSFDVIPYEISLIETVVTVGITFLPAIPLRHFVNAWKRYSDFDENTIHNNSNIIDLTKICKLPRNFTDPVEFLEEIRFRNFEIYQQ